MKINSKVLFSIILIPVCLFFFFYLFWQPDTLVNHIPESTVFYFHLDLNSSGRVGILTQRWIGKELIKSAFKKISSSIQFPLDRVLNKENIDFLSEVGIVGIPLQENDPNHQIQIAVFFKIRKWVNFSSIKNNFSDFNLIQINHRTWLISQTPVFLNKKQGKNLIKKTPKFFEFKNVINPILGEGFLSFDFFNTPNKNFSSYKRSDFEIFSDAVSENLFFSFINPLEEFFQKQDGKTIDQIIINPRTDFSIVLFYKNGNGKEFLENELKKYFALNKPKEIIRNLPDQTYFVELIVDPEAFQFQKKIIAGQEVDYYWFDKELNNPTNGFNGTFEKQEIVVWENQNYLFLTDNEKTFIDFQKFFSSKSFLFEKYNPQKGGYLFFDKFGIKEALFMETEEKNLGLIEFQLN